MHLIFTLYLSSSTETRSTLNKSDCSHFSVCEARLVIISSWLKVGKLATIKVLQRSSLQHLTSQFSTSAPRLCANSRSMVHLLSISRQSRLSVAQSFHSAISRTSLVFTFNTCARNVKQVSDPSFVEQFIASGWLTWFRFEKNSGSNLKHFFGDLRETAVGRILRVLDFGRLGVGTGWLQ